MWSPASFCLCRFPKSAALAVAPLSPPFVCRYEPFALHLSIPCPPFPAPVRPLPTICPSPPGAAELPSACTSPRSPVLNVAPCPRWLRGGVVGACFPGVVASLPRWLVTSYPRLVLVCVRWLLPEVGVARRGGWPSPVGVVAGLFPWGRGADGVGGDAVRWLGVYVFGYLSCPDSAKRAIRRVILRSCVRFAPFRCSPGAVSCPGAQFA